MIILLLLLFQLVVYQVCDCSNKLIGTVMMITVAVMASRAFELLSN